MINQNTVWQTVYYAYFWPSCLIWELMSVPPKTGLRTLVPLFSPYRNKDQNSFLASPLLICPPGILGGVAEPSLLGCPELGFQPLPWNSGDITRDTVQVSSFIFAEIKVIIISWLNGHNKLLIMPQIHCSERHKTIQQTASQSTGQKTVQVILDSSFPQFLIQYHRSFQQLLHLVDPTASASHY